MIQEKVKELISEEISKLGYTFLDVSFLKENGNDVLRVVVDRDDPISLEDIVKVNEVISPIIDEADLIKGRYMLDVTTLGVEKPLGLSHLEKYIGKYVLIHITHPFKGMNNIEGDILEVNKEELILEYREKARKLKANIKKIDIDKARLAIKF